MGWRLAKIWTRVCWRVFSWPYLRNGHAYVTSFRLSVRPSVCHICIVAERCVIGPRLLLITNRKSHTPFQMRWKLSTLDGLGGHWQPVRSAVLATAGLLVLSSFCCRSVVDCQVFCGLVGTVPWGLPFIVRWTYTVYQTASGSDADIRPTHNKLPDFYIMLCCADAWVVGTRECL